MSISLKECKDYADGLAAMAQTHLKEGFIAEAMAIYRRAAGEYELARQPELAEQYRGLAALLGTFLR